MEAYSDSVMKRPGGNTNIMVDGPRFLAELGYRVLHMDLKMIVVMIQALTLQPYDSTTSSFPAAKKPCWCRINLGPHEVLREVS